MLVTIATTATQWTAIASVALSVLTLCLILLTARYVILTGHLTDSATRSAKAAQAAAQSAEKAAQAAQAQSAAAEAALPIDFDVVLDANYDTDPDTGEQFPIIEQLEVTCSGATVFIHSVIIECAIFIRGHDGKIAFSLEQGPKALRFLDPDEEEPIRRHRGEILVCNWSGPIPIQGDLQRYARIGIEYSIAPDSARRTITRVAKVPAAEAGAKPN
jgi:hypothetical protein